MGHSIVSNNSDSCDLNFAKTFPKPQVGPHEFALSIWDFNLKDWPHSGIFSSQQVATPSWNLKTSTSKTLKKILSYIYIMGSSWQTCLCWGLSLCLWCKRIVFEKWIDGNVQLTENCCDLFTDVARVKGQTFYHKFLNQCFSEMSALPWLNVMKTFLVTLLTLAGQEGTRK